MNTSLWTIVGVAAVALLAAWTVLAAPGSGAAAGKKHRVVFQVTQSGQDHWESALGNVEHLQQALGAADTQIEVVVHGKALGMLLAKDNALASRMEKLAGDGSVAFVACQNTMNRKNVTKDQLLPFALTTDSGVAQVVRRQEEGWSYIRAAD